ncbi:MULTISPECIES: diguanylate cyclase [Alphaproteobacteria]|nr:MULTISPECIES: diguanylate cyclase [Alphaproteobacteria]
MTDDFMRMALRELEQASYSHEQWAERLYGTLICRAVPDEADLRSDAHRLCAFGHWYYQTGSVALGSHPGFREIGMEHERMHQCATKLLKASRSGVAVAPADYQRFVAALKDMNLEIATVREDLRKALFNLDPLTGAPSRAGMLSALREQQKLIRRGGVCSVAMLDLDHFKTINDEYGHMLGDKVLIGVARCVMEHLRPCDQFYRYGGEEFLICLPDTDVAAGRDLLSRVIEEVTALPFEVECKQAFHISASVGVADLDQKQPVERSIDRADKALYMAKAQGRNRVITWDGSMG